MFLNILKSWSAQQTQNGVVEECVKRLRNLEISNVVDESKRLINKVASTAGVARPCTTEEDFSSPGEYSEYCARLLAAYKAANKVSSVRPLSLTELRIKNKMLPKYEKLAKTVGSPIWRRRQAVERLVKTANNRRFGVLKDINKDGPFIPRLIGEECDFVGSNPHLLAGMGLRVTGLYKKDLDSFSLPEKGEGILAYEVEKGETFGDWEMARLTVLAIQLGYSFLMVIGSSDHLWKGTEHVKFLTFDKLSHLTWTSERGAEILREYQTSAPVADTVNRIVFTAAQKVEVDATVPIEKRNWMLLKLDTLVLHAKEILANLGVFLFSSAKYALIESVSASGYLKKLDRDVVSVFRVERGELRGHAFYHRGTIVTAHHVTKGQELHFENERYRCVRSDKKRDMDFYLQNPDPAFFVELNLNDVVSVCDGATTLIGRVISDAPFQIAYGGEARSGWSGLPILKEVDGRVFPAGLYSMHRNVQADGVQAHVTVNEEKQWTDYVVDALAKESVMVSVPCGMGKSTFLIQALSRTYERILMIEPRTAIVQNLGATLNWATCSGEDEYDSGVSKLLMSHGKFASLTLGSSFVESNYDLIVLDECHESSYLTKFVSEYLAARGDIKVLALTATPEVDEFLEYAKHVSRKPRTFIPVKKNTSLSPAECAMAITENASCNSVLVQVPSVKFGEKVASEVAKLPMLKDFEVVQLNRAVLLNKGMKVFMEELASRGKKTVICATSVVAYGVTLDIDTVVISNLETEMVEVNGLCLMNSRRLTKAEFIQWAGRVGRTKPGTVIYPESFTASYEEPGTRETIDAMLAMANGFGDVEVFGKKFSRSRVMSALRMDMPFGMALAFVDERGLVSGNPPPPPSMDFENLTIDPQLGPEWVKKNHVKSQVRVTPYLHYPFVQSAWLRAAQLYDAPVVTEEHDRYAYQTNTFDAGRGKHFRYTSAWSMVGVLFMLLLVGLLMWRLANSFVFTLRGPLRINFGEANILPLNEEHVPTAAPGVVISRFTGKPTFSAREILVNTTGVVYTGFVWNLCLTGAVSLWVVILLLHSDKVEGVVSFLGSRRDPRSTQARNAVNAALGNAALNFRELKFTQAPSAVPSSWAEFKADCASIATYLFERGSVMTEEIREKLPTREEVNKGLSRLGVTTRATLMWMVDRLDAWSAVLSEAPPSNSTPPSAVQLAPMGMQNVASVVSREDPPQEQTPLGTRTTAYRSGEGAEDVLAGEAPIETELKVPRVHNDAGPSIGTLLIAITSAGVFLRGFLTQALAGRVAGLVINEVLMEDECDAVEVYLTHRVVSEVTYYLTREVLAHGTFLLLLKLGVTQLLAVSLFIEFFVAHNPLVDEVVLSFAEAVGRTFARYFPKYSSVKWSYEGKSGPLIYVRAGLSIMMNAFMLRYDSALSRLKRLEYLGQECGFLVNHLVFPQAARAFEFRSSLDILFSRGLLRAMFLLGDVVPYRVSLRTIKESSGDSSPTSFLDEVMYEVACAIQAVAGCVGINLPGVCMGVSHATSIAQGVWLYAQLRAKGLLLTPFVGFLRFVQAIRDYFTGENSDRGGEVERTGVGAMIFYTFLALSCLLLLAGAVLGLLEVLALAMQIKFEQFMREFVRNTLTQARALAREEALGLIDAFRNGCVDPACTSLSEATAAVVSLGLALRCASVSIAFDPSACLSRWTQRAFINIVSLILFLTYGLTDVSDGTTQGFRRTNPMPFLLAYLMVFSVGTLFTWVMTALLYGSGLKDSSLDGSEGLRVRFMNQVLACYSHFGAVYLSGTVFLMLLATGFPSLIGPMAWTFFALFLGFIVGRALGARHHPDASRFGDHLRCRDAGDVVDGVLALLSLTPSAQNIIEAIGGPGWIRDQILTIRPSALLHDRRPNRYLNLARRLLRANRNLKALGESPLISEEAERRLYLSYRSGHENERMLSAFGECLDTQMTWRALAQPVSRHAYSESERLPPLPDTSTGYLQMVLEDTLGRDISTSESLRLMEESIVRPGVVLQAIEEEEVRAGSPVSCETVNESEDENLPVVFSGTTLVEMIWYWLLQALGTVYVSRFQLIRVNVLVYAIVHVWLNEIFLRAANSEQASAKTNAGVLAFVFALLTLDMSFVSKAANSGKQLAKVDLKGSHKIIDWLNQRVALGSDEVLKVKVSPSKPILYHATIAFLLDPSSLFLFAVFCYLTGIKPRPREYMAFVMIPNASILSAMLIGLIIVCGVLRERADQREFYYHALAVGSIVLTGRTYFPVLSLFKDFPLLFEIPALPAGRQLPPGTGQPAVVYEPRTFWKNWVPLPPGVINTRTILSRACVFLMMLDFSRHKKIVSIGTGKGGMLQGLCCEGGGIRKAEIMSFSLPRPTYRLDDRLLSALRRSSCSVTERGEYGSQSLREATLCLVDTFWNPFNVLGTDEVIQPAEEISRWRTLVSNVVSNMDVGADLILYTRFTQCRHLVSQVQCLGMFFSEVSCVVDPLVRGTSSVAIVCRRRLHGHAIEIHSAIRSWPDVVGDTEELHQMFQKYLKALDLVHLGDAVIGDPEFVKCLKQYDVPTEAVPINVSISNETGTLYADIFSEAALYADPMAQLLPSGSLFTWLGNRTVLFSEAVGQYGAFEVAGRLASGPVPDREHVTGINVAVATVLNAAGLLPLPLLYEVPSQSNEMVLAGFKRRYDFPHVPGVTLACSEAIEWFRDFLCERATGYDFSPPSWEELRLEANLRSSAGFMSVSGEKNSKGILDRRLDLLDQVGRDYFDPSLVNHCFHLSPKIERLSSTIGRTRVPRLFSYKTGEVRLVEMRWFKKLNDFMSKAKKFPFSVSGTVFERAERVVAAFERYARPASIQIEGSKWDGHKEVAWFAVARSIFSSVLRSGKGGELAALASERTVWADGVGVAVSCSGHIITMLRGNQKSGGWDTSCNNKMVNSIIALQCAAVGLNVSVAEAFTRVTILIEGDDGLIVGEEEDILKIREMKDDFYAKCGFPQECDTWIVYEPENVAFCSMGATRLSPSGIAVPIRPFTEILGKAVISLVNGSVLPTYENHARALSVVASMCAMYWFDPRVLRLFHLVKGLIPPDVNQREPHPSERWTTVNLLGKLDPATFEPESWVLENLGLDIKQEQSLNAKAMQRMETSYGRSLLSLTREDLREFVHPMIAPGYAVANLVWFEESTDAKELSSFLGRSNLDPLRTVLHCPTSKVCVRNMLSGLLCGEYAHMASSYLSVLRSGRGATVFLVASSEGALFQRLLRLLTDLKALDRFKVTASQIQLWEPLGNSAEYTTTLRRSTFPLLRTSMAGTLIIFLTIVSCFFLLVTTDWSGVTKTGYPRTAAVRKGFSVRSEQEGVMSTLAQLDKLDTKMQMASSHLAPGIPGFLAAFHVARRAESFADDPLLLKRALHALVSCERRFALIVARPRASPAIYTFYLQDHKNLLSSSTVAEELAASIRQACDEQHQVRVDLNERKGRRMKLMREDEWTFNGTMVTAHEWFGESTYGQINRVSALIKAMRLYNGFLVMRISDTRTSLLDGTIGNCLVLGDIKLPGLECGPVILGESEAGCSRDMARPFGCDWNNLVTKPDGGLLNELLFRGGPTGPGFSAQQNVRIALVPSLCSIDTIGKTWVNVGFHRGHSRLRIESPWRVGVSHLDSRWFKEKLSMPRILRAKYQLVMEGNEAPDRTLTLMSGLGVVLYVKPTFVSTPDSWMSCLLEHSVNVWMCEPRIDSIVEAVQTLEASPQLFERIRSAGNKISTLLRRKEVMVRYTQSLIQYSKLFGAMNTFRPLKFQFTPVRGGYHVALGSYSLGSLSSGKLKDERSTALLFKTEVRLRELVVNTNSLRTQYSKVCRLSEVSRVDTHLDMDGAIYFTVWVKFSHITRSSFLFGSKTTVRKVARSVSAILPGRVIGGLRPCLGDNDFALLHLQENLTSDFMWGPVADESCEWIIIPLGFSCLCFPSKEVFRVLPLGNRLEAVQASSTSLALSDESSTFYGGSYFLEDGKLKQHTGKEGQKDLWSIAGISTLLGGMPSKKILSRIFLD